MDEIRDMQGRTLSSRLFEGRWVRSMWCVNTEGGAFSHVGMNPRVDAVCESCGKEDGHSTYVDAVSCLVAWFRNQAKVYQRSADQWEHVRETTVIR